VTHSKYDRAVGRLYPLASMVARQDAADFDEVLARWRATVDDGAQAVAATDVDLGAVGTGYPFRSSGFLNLNGNDVIRTGDGIAGAHSDIFHPEIAWGP